MSGNLADFNAIDSRVEEDIIAAKRLMDANNVREFNQFVFGGRLGKRSRLWRKIILTKDPREREKLLVYARSFREALVRTGLWKPKIQTPKALQHAIE